MDHGKLILYISEHDIYWEGEYHQYVLVMYKLYECGSILMLQVLFISKVSHCIEFQNK